jgi:hypothetical protein
MYHYLERENIIDEFVNLQQQQLLSAEGFDSLSPAHINSAIIYKGLL